MELNTTNAKKYLIIYVHYVTQYAIHNDITANTYAVKKNRRHKVKKVPHQQLSNINLNQPPKKIYSENNKKHV